MKRDLTHTNSTALVLDLVREGRATPQEGARLLRLRRDLQERRDRTRLGPFLRFGVAVGAIFLALFGLRRQHHG